MPAHTAAHTTRRHAAWRTVSAAACALAIAAGLAPGAAQAKDVMTWVMPDFPPAAIPVNGKPGNGVADQAVNFITARWPDAEHRYIYANARRTWEILERGEAVCFPAALRTPERERIAYFSNTNLLPPPVLIVRGASLPSVPLNSAGEADLAALLERAKLHGIVVDKRSYGAAADGAIARRPRHSSLQIIPVSSYGGNILRMIAAKRADYTLDYDFALAYEMSRAPELATLKTVAVAGGSAPVTVGVACPRTPWGRAAIRRIDRLLGTREGAAALMQAQTRWQTEASRQRHAAALAEFTRQRGKPSPASDYE
ncbi:TIGR02285 family protein [Pseudoduganella aquatica]|uniref:TIGR02285 family protein n=1 Tax=Pseudoduganella aquatica TaxID=2660641 RepID=A0A7X4H8I1_9BURK|nr:TIGR02285 family protein [Pseudoduganella aquatica]MYN06614.1 TIGR02285 family protein [Pseudoduganella aquatica]